MIFFPDEENPFFAEAQSTEDSGPSADPRSLFGDSDDSDWEEMDGGRWCAYAYNDSMCSVVYN